MSTPKTVFVRLKPYNKRKGYLCRNYMIGGVRFTGRWQEVSAAKARELSELKQPHDHEGEIPLFDIKTREQAKAIEEQELDEGKRNVARVKDAVRIADREFRDDRPVVDDSGELVREVEAGEVIEDPAVLAAAAKARAAAELSAGERRDVAPAPSLRAAAAQPAASKAKPAVAVKPDAPKAEAPETK